MPELPEVEVLVRNLRPLLRNRTIREVMVRRPKVLAPTSPQELISTLHGARLLDVSRRGKYLVFKIKCADARTPTLVLGHLGMTGRMYLQKSKLPVAKHAAVIMNLGREAFVFEDTRLFGRFTLDTRAVARLGPEALGPEFTVGHFARALKRSSQPIKVKLLDQALVAGIGNIYASESLFRAGLSPKVAARRLKAEQIARLWRAIRDVLSEAIGWGSTVRLDFRGASGQNRLFYYGSEPDPGGFKAERLRVYDHAGDPCAGCGQLIKRVIQAGRSTYYCPGCQRSRQNYQ